MPPQFPAEPDSPACAFDAWLQEAPASGRERGRVWRLGSGGLRFAFYGRISTEGYQDPVSSRAWQPEAANRVIAGRGRVVVEFFDTGTSRSLPWRKRPQAAALLDAAADPDREFDAVVVGEFERAFAGGTALTVIEILRGLGVQMWLPEARGPIDLAEPDHRALLLMLGHQSEREVLRNRSRTSAAMAAQVREQGRHIGGRPPYGYQLVDAGPHPNKIHASWGRRRHRLDVDPVTAPHVRWIFAQRLDGWSAAAIARTLNERRVPSPGAYDRVRNPHRQHAVWTLRTVAAILANPRYAGRQVWNRQFTDLREAVPGDKRSSVGPVRVWNPRAQWVVSAESTHPALVSDEDFAVVQQITAIGVPQDGLARRYALTGLLICGVCGRRMSAHWTHGKPGYRCRHGHTSAHPIEGESPRWVYWSQAGLVGQLQATDVRFCDLQDAEELASHLKARDLVLVCGPGTLTVEAAALEPTEDAEASVTPAAATAPAPRRRKPEPLQLALPFPADRRRRSRWLLSRKTQMVKQTGKTENPTGSHVRRE
ncbi:putative recombinase [Actinoplanes cyaneus]|uniref:Recombinase n=1 Tax=Actinoplanes cyaneus TaxID=52696 RepID=A0A919MCL3_9ACTN|nr:recombinase family protein [Actinoplanes cyaneus]MCW2144098.1 Site-specific DNA recombinase [Actinoplanes cyaneus]GID70789.1 putative recombinase [Actinoplanes cyaneus]